MTGLIYFLGFWIYYEQATSAAATALGTLAASMQPGTWAQLNTNNISELAHGNVAGNIAPYAMTSVWDPGTGRIYFQGQDHSSTGGLEFVRYDDATNSWSNAGPIPNAPSHGYDHLTLDDVHACLAYAREVLQSERVFATPA